MLPLQTHADIKGVKGVQVLKILDKGELARSKLAPANCLLWDEQGSAKVSGLLAGAISPTKFDSFQSGRLITIQNLRDANVVAPGDVIRIAEGRSLVSVLYRRRSRSNTLLVTERCNSKCLMCSQPPKDVSDRPYVENALSAIPLIDPEAEQIGVSGGEPTLLGDDLLQIINSARHNLPKTCLHILSNGRGFANRQVAQVVSSVRHPNVLWGIPLYSDVPEIHDYIVQARGAWHETTRGLANLGSHGSKIELRVVLQRQNSRRLGELAHFIFRNLTFVEHIAFMGLEPMGYARKNHENIWIDPQDFGNELTDAVHFLANRGMNVSIFNLPLCVLPQSLWPFAAQSISDWKNVYLPECGQCVMKNECGGFFKSVSKNWVGRQFGSINSQGVKNVGAA